MLMEKLDIPYWHFVVGGSLGGMQALQWSIAYPDKIKKAGIFAAAAKSSTQNKSSRHLESALMHCAYDVIAESGPYNHFGQHIQPWGIEVKECFSRLLLLQTKYKPNFP